MAQQSHAIEIFCCYAREDFSHLTTLKTHLSPLQRQGIIHIWHDGDIRAGIVWDQAIKQYLNEANIILLLISPDFIASDACYDTEMKHALERHKDGKARVIPIWLRPIAYWEKVTIGNIQLGQLQALPTNARAVTTWTDPDAAWKDVVEEIGQVINELQEPLSVGQSSIYNQQGADALVRFSQGRDSKEPLNVRAHAIQLYSPAMAQLCEALLHGYPMAADLKLLIAYELHENIEVIATGSNLDEKVHSLVVWAISTGNEKALVTGALKRRPGNPKLRQFAMQYGF